MIHPIRMTLRSLARQLAGCAAVILLLLSPRAADAASLGATQATVGNAAGTGGVFLAADGSWTAVSNQPWLQVTPASQSGTGNANVAFSFAANAGGTRTATLTIAGQTFTVTQAGATYVAARSPITVVQSPLVNPAGVAVDGAGNLYVADNISGGQGPGALYKFSLWGPTPQTEKKTLPFSPYDVAVNPQGDVYVTDSYNLYRWLPATAGGAVTIVPLPPKHRAHRVAVDAAGSVYIADTGWQQPRSTDYVVPPRIARLPAGATQASQFETLVGLGADSPWGIARDVAGNCFVVTCQSLPMSHTTRLERWVPGAKGATTLLTNIGLSTGVAVDGLGSVYMAGQSSIKVWRPTAQKFEILAYGQGGPGNGCVTSVAVDEAGTVYFADVIAQAIVGIPNAFVDPTPVSVYGSGKLTLPPVLPTSVNLNGPFLPTSDSPWLTVTKTENGIVHYAIKANYTAANRVGQLSVLGQKIPIIQTPTTPSLSASALLEGQEAGADGATLIYEGDVPWTATSDSPWLTLAPTSVGGTASTIVRFNFTANPGATRVGTITIASPGLAQPLTLQVTQAGQDYVSVLAQSTLTAALESPSGVAVGPNGSVYIADEGTNGHGALKQWTPSTPGVVNTLVGPLGTPARDVAMDGQSVYYSSFSDASDGAIGLWTQSGGGGNVVPNPIKPLGLAADPNNDDVYFVEQTQVPAITKWQSSTNQLVVVASLPITKLQALTRDWQGSIYFTKSAPVPQSGSVPGPITYAKTINKVSAPLPNPNPVMIYQLGTTSQDSAPRAVALDDAGNLYSIDSDLNQVVKVLAPDFDDKVVLAPNLTNPVALAVDANRGLYVADLADHKIVKLVSSHVSTAAQTVAAAGGTFALPEVLPTTVDLSGTNTPTSDQAWLTIGTTSQGIVNYSVTPNTSGANRTAHITVLGQSITVTQSP